MSHQQQWKETTKSKNRWRDSLKSKINSRSVKFKSNRIPEPLWFLNPFQILTSCCPSPAYSTHLFPVTLIYLSNVYIYILWSSESGAKRLLLISVSCSGLPVFHFFPLPFILNLMDCRVLLSLPDASPPVPLFHYGFLHWFRFFN